MATLNAVRRKIPAAQIGLKCALVLLCALCVIPTWMVVAASFTSESSITMDGFHLIPREWSIEGYRYILNFGSQIVQSYKVTLFAVAVGTILTLWITSMAAYVISRKQFIFRNFVSFYFLLTMLINGGLLASYLVYTNIWHMRNNLLVLVLPGAFSAMNCFVMRSFIQSNVPDALVEAAKIDGAGEWFIYVQVVIPLMLPALAAIGFMTAVGHWNEWSTSYLFITEANLMPLQLLLLKIESQFSYLEANAGKLSPDQQIMLLNTPKNTARMALLITVIIPVMLVYPFFQKYFIKGITLGAMKG